MNKIKLYIVTLCVLLCELLCVTACQNKDQVIRLEDIYATEAAESADSVKNTDTAELKSVDDFEDYSEAAEIEVRKLAVFVCGAVERPGVYELNEGARVNEALSMAGGFTADADLCYVNLAKPLTDGLQLYFPTKEEVENMGVSISEDEATAIGASEGARETGAGKVNINTATVEQLMTLNGIGQSKAEAIVSYRQEKGLFKSVQELVNVTGIGEGTLKKLLPLICV